MLPRLLALVLALSLVPDVAAALDAPDYRWVRDGRVEVIDGETIRFEGKPAKLWGVSAPALDQTCKLRDGSDWPCGEWARDRLVLFAGSELNKCFGMGKGPNPDGSENVVCWNERHNLNADMVWFGAAVVDRRQSRANLHYERFAAKEGLGLWSGEFEPPWQWRERKRRI